MSSLEYTDNESKAVQKPGHPRVSLSDIESNIAGAEFWTPMLAPQMTVCVLCLKNGYAVIGKSAPADPANFDTVLGMKFAREDAVRQIWPLMGYGLRERLHAESHKKET